MVRCGQSATSFFLSHLVFAEPDNRRKDRASNAAACNLANERADVDRARGVGK